VPAAVEHSCVPGVWHLSEHPGEGTVAVGSAEHFILPPEVIPEHGAPANWLRCSARDEL